MKSKTSVSSEDISNNAKYSCLVEALNGSLAVGSQPVYTIENTAQSRMLDKQIMKMLEEEKWDPDAQWAVSCSNEAGSSALLLACAHKAKTLFDQLQDGRIQWDPSVLKIPLPQGRRLLVHHEGTFPSDEHDLVGVRARFGCRADGAMTWINEEEAMYDQARTQADVTSYRDAMKGTKVLFECKDIPKGLKNAVPQSCTAAVLFLRLAQELEILHIADGGVEYRMLFTKKMDELFYHFAGPVVKHRQNPRKLVADLFKACAWGPSPDWMIPRLDPSGLRTSKEK